MAPLLRRLRQALASIPPPLLVAGVVLIAAAASAALRAGSATGPPPGPRLPTPDSRLPTPDPQADRGNDLTEAVHDAFEAAKKGDLHAYLARFAEPLKGELSRTRAEKGDAYLRDYLTRSTAAVKGLAMDLTRTVDAAPGTVVLPVEFVYADRNEIQPFTLVRDGDRWRISRIESVRATATLIPYGTHIQNVR